MHRLISLVGLVALLALVMAGTGCDSYNNWRTYSEAYEAANREDFEQAFQLLESIPNSKDRKNIRPVVTYHYADYLASVKRFEQALPLFERIPDFEDSKDRIHSTYLAWAERLTAMGEHGKALEIYKKIGEESRILPTLLSNATSMIEQEKYGEALASLEGVTGDATAEDLIKTAEKGALYRKGIELIDANDFSTARKIFEQAAKIQHEQKLMYEAEYLRRYCRALRDVTTRMGSEGRYGDVLAAVFPVRQLILDVKSDECIDCLKILKVASDYWFFTETSSSDWHTKIKAYRKKYTDITARCDIYGGLINHHLNRTKRLINVLKAGEQIGGECNQSLSSNWEEAVKALELHLSTMVLDWKRTKNFKKIILLQKYITTGLEGLKLGIGTWRTLQEGDVQPEYNFGAAHFKGNKYLVTGWVLNKSNYRPMIIKSILLDCTNKANGEIATRCASVKIDNRILPGEKKALSGRVDLPKDMENIIDYKMDFEYEDVDVTTVTAEDIVGMR